MNDKKKVRVLVVEHEPGKKAIVHRLAGRRAPLRDMSPEERTEFRKFVEREGGFGRASQRSISRDITRDAGATRKRKAG